MKRSLYSIFNLVLLFSVLYFTACKNSKNVEVQMIDSLQSALSESLETMAKISDEKNKELSTAIDTNIKYFTQNLKDTIKFDVGIMFQQYKVVHKEINRYNQIKGQLKDNIEYTINQLEKLKNDYSSGKIDKEKFDSYIKTEKEEAIKLIEMVKERETTLTFEYKQFDSLHPLVLDFNKKIKI